MEIRLSKYLADGGVSSRRRAEELIIQGLVKVNGEIVDVLGTKVMTGKDIVEYDGRVISVVSDFVYIMLHKPKGYITTVDDDMGRPSVMELVADIDQRIVPVGRLDFNTSGLLLMTNDGGLTYKLTHPKHSIEKTYIAKVDGEPSLMEMERFRSGLYIEDYKTSPAKIFVIKKEGASTTLKITIGEGRNRQVRKMCETIGHRVTDLKRVATGRLYLGELEGGKYRHLTEDEVEYLKKC